MNTFDNDLRQALARRPPPTDLAERILARMRQAETRRSVPQRVSYWWASAAAVVILASAPALYLRHARQVQGEKAKEDVMRSLRLTAAKLQVVQDRVAEAGRRQIDISIP
jgi:hypothetical protein